MRKHIVQTPETRIKHIAQLREVVPDGLIAEDADGIVFDD